MMEIMGLPIKTVIIVGGLFILSAFAPTITALIIRHRGGWKDE